LPRTLRNIEELNFLAAKDYVPRVYAGRVTLFWATGELTASYDLEEGWRELVSGDVEVHEIPGNHIDIIKEPHVRVLAEELRACLDAVEERQPCVGPRAPRFLPRTPEPAHKPRKRALDAQRNDVEKRFAQAI